jgi:ADP-ribose pyrophosphatase
LIVKSVNNWVFRMLCWEEVRMPREYPEAPVVGVGAVIVKDGQVLLVRRAHPPSQGQWSIPGGVVELGETLTQAAAREAHEECQVEVEIGSVLSTVDVIERDATGRICYHYVLIDLAARYVGGEPRPGSDALEVRWAKRTELDSLDIIARLLPVLQKALHQEAESMPSRQ